MSSDPQNCKVYLKMHYRKSTRENIVCLCRALDKMLQANLCEPIKSSVWQYKS